MRARSARLYEHDPVWLSRRVAGRLLGDARAGGAGGAGLAGGGGGQRRLPRGVAGVLHRRRRLRLPLTPPPPPPPPPVR